MCFFVVLADDQVLATLTLRSTKLGRQVFLPSPVFISSSSGPFLVHSLALALSFFSSFLSYFASSFPSLHPLSCCAFPHLFSVYKLRLAVTVLVLTKPQSGQLLISFCCGKNSERKDL